MNASPATPTTLNRRATDLSEPDRDKLLQSSRRVDWRFLLPQPELTEAAYIGGADQGLIESLRQFCSSLTMLDGTSPNSAPIGRFPLVVATNPNQNELAQAAQAACSGGFVYVEVSPRRGQRKLRGRESRPLSGVNSCLAAMHQLHLAELQAHWHWPSFDSCNEIIPLHDHAATVCALRRRGSGFRSRWKSRLALLLLKSHFLARLVLCFSVLGRRCQSQDSGNRSTAGLDT